MNGYRKFRTRPETGPGTNRTYRRAGPHVIPVDYISGPRPTCNVCTWAGVCYGHMYLKCVSRACPVHGKVETV